MVKGIIKRILVFGGLTLLVIGGWWLHSWWNQPAVSQSDTANGPVNDVLGADTTLVPWQTLYFSTRIPSSLLVKSSREGLPRPVVGSYLLTSTTPGVGDQLGITVAELGNNSLSEMSGVKLRLNQPERYSRTSRSYAPAGAYVFSGRGGYETAVFWQHGTYYAAAVVSGSSLHQAELEQALQAVVSNWQWRE